MAFTQYSGTDGYTELACIVCSHDGNTWVVPAGLTNPISAIPTSDTTLVMSVDGLTMYCVDRPFAGHESIAYQKSTDGFTWSAPVEIIAPTSPQAVLSPSVVWDGTQYRMWTIDMSYPAPQVIQQRTCPTIEGTWSAPINCTADFPTGFGVDRWWHGDVILVSGVYWQVTNIQNVDGSGTGCLWLLKSTDGINWIRGESPVMGIGKSGAWDVGTIYRSSIIANGNNFDLWYGAHDLGAPIRWHIGRTIIYKS